MTDAWTNSFATPATASAPTAVQNALTAARARFAQLQNSGRLSPSAAAAIKGMLDLAEVSVSLSPANVQGIVDLAMSRLGDETTNTHDRDNSRQALSLQAQQVQQAEALAHSVARIEASAAWIDPNNASSIRHYLDAVAIDAPADSLKTATLYLKQHDQDALRQIDAFDRRTKEAHAVAAELAHKKLLAMADDPNLPEKTRADMRLAAEQMYLYRSTEVQEALLAPGATPQHAIAVVEQEIQNKDRRMANNPGAAEAARREVQSHGATPPARPVTIVDIREIYSSEARAHAAREALVFLSKGQPCHDPQAAQDATKLMMYNTQSVIDMVEHLPQDLKASKDHAKITQAIVDKFFAHMSADMRANLDLHREFVTGMVQTNLEMLERETGGDLNKLDLRTLNPNFWRTAAAGTMDKYFDSLGPVALRRYQQQVEASGDNRQADFLGHEASRRTNPMQRLQWATEDVLSFADNSTRVAGAEAAMVIVAKGQPCSEQQGADSAKLMLYNTQMVLDAVAHLPPELRRTNDRVKITDAVVQRFYAAMPDDVKRSLDLKPLFVKSLVEATLTHMGDLSKVDANHLDAHTLAREAAADVSTKFFDRIGAGTLWQWGQNAANLDHDPRAAAFWQKEALARATPQQLQQWAPLAVAAAAATADIHQFAGQLNGWGNYREAGGQQVFATDAKGQLSIDTVIHTLRANGVKGDLEHLDRKTLLQDMWNVTQQHHAGIAHAPGAVQPHGCLQPGATPPAAAHPTCAHR